mgnify:CR=1 FL=1
MKVCVLTFFFSVLMGNSGFSQNFTEVVYDNGVLVREVIVDGDHSKVKSYYENGSLKELSSFVNERAHGQWIRYDERGKKVSQGNFVNGEKEGDWTIWSANDQIQYTIRYQDNTQISIVKVEEQHNKQFVN